MHIDKYLILSQSEWGELFSNKKLLISAYISVIIGYVLVLVNDGMDLFIGIVSLKSIYAAVILTILTNLSVGLYLKKVISIPLAILAFGAVYIIVCIYSTFVLHIPINSITVCYSVMYFIINSLVFRLRVVFVLNAIMFFSISACVLGTTYFVKVGGDPSAQSLLINAIILSAAGFLLQHLVLTVRAMLIEQLGATRFRIAALEAEIQIQNAKKEARDKAIRLNRISIVEAMGASIAHEINQPIGAALTYCHAARNWAATECRGALETLQALQGVENNVGRAAKLIENIRLLTTNKARKYEVVDIVELVRDQIALVQAEFERRGIELIDNIRAESMTAVVCAPEVALATLNLLRNAIEAFDEAADQAFVSVRCLKVDPDWIEIAIADNGRGLSDEELSAAFGAFHTTKESGAGIGLSICQEVAEHHSGSISLQANSDGGVTATLRLAANMPEN